MKKDTREQNIKAIIDMEERICQCNRCPSLTRCIRKPSLGKGDLEPQIVLVFECESEFTRNLDKIIPLRDCIKEHFSMDKIYHTFLVRCQPKACSSSQNTNSYMDIKLLDKDYNCLLTNQKCDGIAIKPSNPDIMACLPFLLEELQILKPNIVILFGQRVSEYLLKAYGVFSPVELGQMFKHGNSICLTTVDEKDFNSEECKKIVKLSDIK